MQIMWDNGSKASPFFIVAFYAFSHYCSAVTMFKELDMREAGSTYFSDVLSLFQRCLDVLFYDIQMVASVVHSNRMLEGMTQVCTVYAPMGAGQLTHSFRGSCSQEGLPAGSSVTVTD